MMSEGNLIYSCGFIATNMFYIVQPSLIFMENENGDIMVSTHRMISNLVISEEESFFENGCKKHLHYDSQDMNSLQEVNQSSQ